ncbi:hypothetical protein CSKR_101877 [Clonorchis sinensis]|uniref:Uncharacterized protein n=1 Tax=Clonorchis sinensis TaxID=79923 RepID=A0A419QC54_CLOSI|nr:hypothetical protein CSKR_101877 [Clonorchis sinensis]
MDRKNGQMMGNLQHLNLNLPGMHGIGTPHLAVHEVPITFDAAAERTKKPPWPHISENLGCSNKTPIVNYATVFSDVNAGKQGSIEPIVLKVNTDKSKYNNNDSRKLPWNWCSAKSVSYCVSLLRRLALRAFNVLRPNFMNFNIPQKLQREVHYLSLVEPPDGITANIKIMETVVIDDPMVRMEQHNAVSDIKHGLGMKPSCCMLERSAAEVDQGSEVDSIYPDSPKHLEDFIMAFSYKKLVSYDIGDRLFHWIQNHLVKQSFENEEFPLTDSVNMRQRTNRQKVVRYKIEKEEKGSSRRKTVRSVLFRF